MPKGCHFSVTAAITKNRLLGFKIIKASMQFNELGIFFIQLLKEYPDILINRSKYYFIMDNARVHTAREFQPFGININILFNASYCPFLNPIEEMFGLWKHHFRRINFSNDKSASHNVCFSAEKIKNEKLLKYYLHSIKYVLISLLQRSIE